MCGKKKNFFFVPLTLLVSHSFFFVPSSPFIFIHKFSYMCRTHLCLDVELGLLHTCIHRHMLSRRLLVGEMSQDGTLLLRINEKTYKERYFIAESICRNILKFHDRKCIKINE